jgi:hypothetical protein
MLVEAASFGLCFSPGMHAVATPVVSFKTGRKIRQFALHPRLEDQGVHCMEFMGCEAAFWFHSSCEDSYSSPDTSSECNVNPSLCNAFSMVHSYAFLLTVQLSWMYSMYVLILLFSSP